MESAPWLGNGISLISPGNDNQCVAEALFPMLPLAEDLGRGVLRGVLFVE
jgi:hypothetical protein